MNKTQYYFNNRCFSKTLLLSLITAFSFIIIASPGSFAQSGPGMKWEKYIGESFTSLDNLNDVEETDDGYLFCGNTDYQTGQIHSVVKLDHNGTVMWDKTFPEPSYPNELLLTPDGGFLLLGILSHVIKVSSSGEQKWVNNNLVGYVKAVNAEGGHLLLRPQHELAPSQSLVKINHSGAILWEKILEDGYFSNIINTKDGGFLLVKQGMINNQNDIAIIKINSVGTQEWEKAFGGSEGEYNFGIIPAPNGGYVLLNHSWSPRSGNKTAPMQGTWIFKIAEDGTMEWDINPPDYDNYNYKIITSNNSGFYITTDEGTKFLEKFNWDGKYIYRSELANVESPTKIFKATSDGGFIAGTEDYKGGYVITAQKYTSDNPTMPTSLYRAINLNSSTPSLLIGNVGFEGSKVAANFNAVGRNYENQNIVLNPATDPNRAKMIRSTIYGTASSPATFTFSNVPSAFYEVYLYVWEDNKNTTYSLTLNGKQIIQNYQSGSAGSWAKLGPFKTLVKNGKIELKTFGGDANISGIEVRKEEPTFERALNLNSASNLVIDNKLFEGSKMAANFSYTGRTYEDQTITLNPATDPNRAKMIRSSIYCNRLVRDAYLYIGTKNNGFYDVYLYTWEDNISANYSLYINGDHVEIVSPGIKGSWKKIGPYRTYVTNNQIVIRASSDEGGNLSGVELYSHEPINSRVVTRLAEEEKEESKKNDNVIVFPNYLSEKVTVHLPQSTSGEVKVQLYDSYGKTYMQISKRLKDEKSLNLDLPPTLGTGIYLLKVRTNNNEYMIRVGKN